MSSGPQGMDTPPAIPVESERRDRPPPAGPFAASGPKLSASPGWPGGNVRRMVTTVETTGAAVFMDLDRTLLRGASGLVLGAAMRAEGLFDGRPSLPGESLFYRLYDIQGESLAFMAMVRAAPRFTKGWDVDAVRRAGKRA